MLGNVNAYHVSVLGGLCACKWSKSCFPLEKLDKVSVYWATILSSLVVVGGYKSRDEIIKYFSRKLEVMTISSPAGYY